MALINHHFISSLRGSKITTFLVFIMFALTTNAQYYRFGFPSEPVRQQVEMEQSDPPEFKGGRKGLENFLVKNFQNPSERKELQGKIVVAVIVGVKGKVIDAQVVRHLSADLDDEALRVARKLKFKPATVGKHKVKARVDVAFPIRHGVLSFFEFDTIDV